MAHSLTIFAAAEGLRGNRTTGQRVKPKEKRQTQEASREERGHSNDNLLKSLESELAVYEAELTKPVTDEIDSMTATDERGREQTGRSSRDRTWRVRARGGHAPRSDGAIELGAVFMNMSAAGEGTRAKTRTSPATPTQRR